MRIWLDDLRPMPDGFTHSFVNWRDCYRFIIANNGDIKLVSFDHDLGENMGTGYDLAINIELGARRGTIKPFEWKVHSANPVGAENIKMAMKSAERFWSQND